MSLRKSIILLIVSAICAPPAAAVEIYKWVDDEGVIHFSDEQPVDATSNVSSFVIAASNPADYDPAADEYSIQNQASRINETYKKIEEKREARAEERAEAAEKAAQYERQFVRYYDEPIRSYFPPVVRPWWPQRPPHHYYPSPHGGQAHHPRPRHHKRYSKPMHRPVTPGQSFRQARPAGSGSKVRWAPSRQVQ